MTKLLLLFSVLVSLYGCGTKGPLYIPEQAYPQPAQSERLVPTN